MELRAVAIKHQYLMSSWERVLVSLVPSHKFGACAPGICSREMSGQLQHAVAQPLPASKCCSAT